MALDAPSGNDAFIYRVLPDIDAYGVSYSPYYDAIRLPDSLSPCQRVLGLGVVYMI